MMTEKNMSEHFIDAEVSDEKGKKSLNILSQQKKKTMQENKNRKQQMIMKMFNEESSTVAVKRINSKEFSATQQKQIYNYRVWQKKKKKNDEVEAHN